ncbi:MAG: tRNA (N(6)-L-threonylcarbamoyladenosine(37)-C(2))-methylthiotransferase MtaB [Alphaproteobacteria bacterium]
MAIDIRTFGCRLNTLESEIIRARTAEAGLDAAILFNTCAVTGEAVRQARQAIRRAARENPDTPIIVTGCAAQIDPQAFADMPEVAQVIGNREKLTASAYAQPALGEAGKTGAARVRVNDIMAIRQDAPQFAPQMVDHLAGRSRAYVQVQTGCDHRCTFCIIPYGRGNSRSVAAGAVVEQVRRLVGNGYREVVLTGVDITSWGGELPGTPKLGALVRAILRHVPELERLRLSSIDAIEIDSDLWRALSEEERLMPHLHLSLQSGDDMILKRMKRRHLRGDAIALCEKARRLRPDIVFGADLIAGFPTETDAMFENSLALIDDCGLTFLHVFPFSPRTGTPAARMPQCERSVSRQRAARLRARGKVAKAATLSAMIGTTQAVLVEKPDFGHTPHFAGVTLVDAEPGTIQPVTITGTVDGRLIGALPETSPTTAAAVPVPEPA